MNIKKLIRPNIRSLSAYQAKEIPCIAKLDANESPFGFTIAKEIIQSVQTNRYPDPEAKSLKKTIAKDLKIRPGNILQGNGSDELVTMMFKALVNKGDEVITANPTFLIYKIVAQIFP